MINLDGLKQLIIYNPDTGIFNWKYIRAGSGKVNKEAGHVTDKGYRRIRILSKNYFAHKLAWFYMTGEWPPDGLQVDHINRNRLDNRWCNLRLLTREQNCQNCHGQSNNTSGFKGVTKRGNKYEANLYHHGKLEYLGWFNSALEASNAYEKRVDEVSDFGALVNKVMS